MIREKLGSGSLVCPDAFDIQLRRLKGRGGWWYFKYTERLADTAYNRRLTRNTQRVAREAGTDWKFDGLTISFTYKKCRLRDAANALTAEFMSWSTMAKLTLGHLHETIVRDTLLKQSIDKLMDEREGLLLAAITFVGDTNGLDTARMLARAEAKLALFKKWDAEQKK